MAESIIDLDIEQQTLGVDGVLWATVKSKYIIKAVENAITGGK